MIENTLDNNALQARFSKLIASFQEAVLVENEKREVLLANKAFCTMFGFDTEPETLTGMDCSGAAEEFKNFFKDPDGFVARIDAILDAKEIVIGDELEMVNGVFLERDYVPVFLEHKYLGHMWKYKNITDHKNLLFELSEAKSEVERKNKELENFASIASHDLKTPLRGIASLAEWISEGIGSTATGETKEHLTLMKSRVIKMQGLIDGILEYAKVGSEQDPSETCNMHTIASEVISRVKEQNDAKIELQTELPSIKFKKVALEQVFANLINNAVHHNDKEIPHIQIRHEDKKSCVRIFIKDNGPGIPEKHLDKIFEMFQTFGKATNNHENTGIGLAVVKKIIEDHSGEIVVDTTFGEGTTFEITLPK